MLPKKERVASRPCSSPIACIATSTLSKLCNRILIAANDNDRAVRADLSIAREL